MQHRAWLSVGVLASTLTVAQANAADPKPAPSTTPMMVDYFAPARELVPYKRPSYVPTVDGRGLALVFAYTVTASAIGFGAAAIGFEVDRASIAGSRPVGTCNRSLPSRPSFCWLLPERIEQRDSFGTLAGSLGGVAATLWSLFIVADTRDPILVPAAGKDSAGFIFSGVW